MLNDNLDISIHHVGGRAGTMQFPYLPDLFEKELERVLYDADENCIEEIKALSKSISKRIVLPYCISDHTGKESFYLMPDRYESSLLPPEYIEPESYFVESCQFGWDLDMHNPDEVLELEVTTLDELFINQSSETEAGPPDFLSLDVEKAEPKVLNGAKKLLHSHVLSFQCEFGLHTTFNSIMDISRENQFKLVDLSLGSYDYIFKYKRQLPIGLRAEKANRPDVGEIYFLKQPEAIIANHRNPLLDLLKTAFISFIHFKFRDMYTYIEKWEALEGSSDFLKENYSKKNYLTFLKKFMELFKVYPQIYPLRFSTIYPTSEFRSNRFSNKHNTSSPEHSRKIYFEQVDINVFKKYVPFLFNNDYIAIEELCAVAGLKEHADLLRERRLRSIIHLLTRLGLVEFNNNTCRIKTSTFQNL